MKQIDVSPSREVRLRTYGVEEFDNWCKSHVTGFANEAEPGGLSVVLSRADRQVCNRARRRGYFSEEMADRIAIALGTMPFEIWPGWYDIDLEVELDTESTDRSCHWCGTQLRLCDVSACSVSCRDAMRTQAREDRERADAWQRRVHEVSCRVSAMDPGELQAWTGAKWPYVDEVLHARRVRCVTNSVNRRELVPA